MSSQETKLFSGSERSVAEETDSESDGHVSNDETLNHDEIVNEFDSFTPENSELTNDATEFTLVESGDRRTQPPEVDNTPVSNPFNLVGALTEENVLHNTPGPSALKSLDDVANEAPTEKAPMPFKKGFSRKLVFSSGAPPPPPPPPPAPAPPPLESDAESISDGDVETHGGDGVGGGQIIY